jgi:aspartyl-tRNA(Asn)/glutamyl-tRNA(Gln) amidotransferase subunit A
VPANYFWDFDAPASEAGGEARPGLDPEVSAAVRRAIADLEDLGATVEEVTVVGLEELPQGSTDMYVERGFFVEELPPERRERFSERYRDSVTRGLEAPASSYLRTLQHTQRVQAALNNALEGIDALVLPTTPIVAPSIEATEAAATRAEEAAAAARARGDPTPPTGGPTASIGRYTSPFNRSGHPAITVPCGFSAEGLPIGMMIVGERFQEGMVLRIGHAFQQATQWHTRRPSP